MKKFIMPVVVLVLFILGSIIFNGYSKNSTEILAENATENATIEKPKDFKCLKCHKGSKSLENMAKEKNIDSAEKLRFLVREGPKSGLHITVPDEDLEKAIQYLDLK
jgi:hypothetical protein